MIWTLEVQLSGGGLQLVVEVDDGWARDASDEEWEFVTGLVGQIRNLQRIQLARDKQSTIRDQLSEFWRQQQAEPPKEPS